MKTPFFTLMAALILGLPLGTFSQAPGDIVVTEFHPQPNTPFFNGEFIELYNTTAAPIDIDGWTLRDAGADLHVINNAGPLIIPAMDYLVLVRNGVAANNGGIPVVDYVYGTAISLDNLQDEIILETPGGIQIEAVLYDKANGWPIFPGRSVERLDPGFASSDTCGWVETATAPANEYGSAGDYGTPGLENFSARPAGVDGDIVINELMINPAAAPDPQGEWIELYNKGAAPVNINGWILFDEQFDNHNINNGGPLIIPPGGFLILGYDNNVLTNGGVIVDYVYAPDMTLGNVRDEVILRDNFGTIVDHVEYDDTQDFDWAPGQSIQLTGPTLENNTGCNWIVIPGTTFGNGDEGTPGGPNIPASVLSAELAHLEASLLPDQKPHLAWSMTHPQDYRAFLVEIDFLRGPVYKVWLRAYPDQNRYQWEGNTPLAAEATFHLWAENHRGDRHHLGKRELRPRRIDHRLDVELVNDFGVNLHTNLAGPMRWQLHSLQGVLIDSGRMENHIHRISMAGKPAGIYLVQVVGGQQVLNHRFYWPGT